jgi:predicted TIM-barrel fold metal-dependent hydrolase
LKVYDANTYLGSWPYWRVDIKSADQLNGSLRSNGVDKALVSSLRSVFFDQEEGNRELLAACKKHPKRLFGLATLTPFFSKKETGCQGLKSGALRGIRLYPQYHWFNLSYATKVFELAERLDVPVVLPNRLASSWPMAELPIDSCISAAARFPKVTFVFSCFNYDAMGAVLSHQFPKNLLVETSGLQMVRGVEMLVEALGSEKVMLGTALPVQYPQAGLQKVLHAKLTKKQMEAVTWRNAARVFGID